MTEPLRVTCAHDCAKLCAECAKREPYMVFTRDGYRWGPGRPEKVGQKPRWQS